MINPDLVQYSDEYYEVVKTFLTIQKPNMFGIQNCAIKSLAIKSLANYLQLSSERDCQQLNHSSFSRSEDHVCDGLVLVFHGSEQQAGSVPQ